MGRGSVPHIRCHRPRRRTIQYSRDCRGIRRSRGVLDSPPSRGMTAVVLAASRVTSAVKNITPDVRKRPWGAGAFCSRLGVGVVYISTWRLWGAGKEPREFKKLVRSP
ncbi:hypothetical protein DXU04_17865 [Bradyrhizobium diazoefficiens]|nr:hypothetical protein EI171_38685 [Bradyrhizobium sp. LCT2]